MKGSRTQTSKQNKQGMTHKSKPDERDDLDSRKEKESIKSKANSKNKN